MVVVRPAVRDDAPAVVGLLHQLGYQLEPARHLTLFAVLIKRGEHLALVAEAAGEVVGFLNLNFRAFLRYGELVGTVDELCVDERRRGEGIGAQLIQAAIAAARQRGAHHLELTTNKRRVDALRFYERVGFEVTSQKLVYPLSEKTPEVHQEEMSHARS